jgi:hypothetical protein
VQTGRRFVASGNDRIASQIGERIEMQVGHVSHMNSNDDPPTGGNPSSRRTPEGPLGSARITMNNAPGVRIGQQVGVYHGDLSVFMDRPDPAGQCGQTTADGTPCERLGTCPPGTHHPRRRSTGKKGKR